MGFLKGGASLSDVNDGQVTTHMTGRCTLDAYPAEPVDPTGGSAPRLAALECSVEQLSPVARPSPGLDPLRRAWHESLHDYDGAGLIMQQSAQAQQKQEAVPKTVWWEHVHVDGLWPMTHFNRTHVVPPCTITEEDLREGLAILDEALEVADRYYTGN